MTLRELNILNYRNIRDAHLVLADKVNCFVGLNGQGKTNILDAIYLLSFTKSALTPLDSQNITHGEEMAMVQGRYGEGETVTCGLKRGQKKQFRHGQNDYHRLTDHIGLIPLIIVSPQDQQLIGEGSDERRRFLDQIISQYDRTYLEHLSEYNALLRQRNSLLKQMADSDGPMQEDLLEVLELRMIPSAEYIYDARSRFTERFIPVFQQIYDLISGGGEQVSLRYVSQLQDRHLDEAMRRTRQRDLILGWTSQGIHKDELEMLLDGYPLKRVGSQGQQKTYLLAMKLAQAEYLNHPILLLDDVFDRLDSRRVERILSVVQGERFGQIFITDTDRQHLTELMGHMDNARIFHVEEGHVV